MKIVGVPLDLLQQMGLPHPEAERLTANPIPEAQVANLAEVAERYNTPCPFKVGEFITPRPNYGLRHAGIPHVVLEVVEPYYSEMNHSEDSTSSRYRRKLDIRVAHYFDGDITAFWNESWMYERWVHGMKNHDEEAARNMKIHLERSIQ